MGPLARRSHVAIEDHGRAARRRQGTPDGSSTRIGQQPGRASSQSRIRSRDARVADPRHGMRGSDECHQGRSQHGESTSRLVVTTRCVAVRQQREPRNVRCDAVGGSCLTPRLPPLAARERQVERRQERRVVVEPAGAAVVCPEQHLVGRRRQVGAWRIQCLQRSPCGFGRPFTERAVDRRRTPGRQSGWRILHVVRQRPLVGAAQLERQRRLRPNHGARVGPRVPQHAIGTPHTDAAQFADGPCGNGKHLL